MLTISNLCVTAGGKEILKGIDLVVNPGEIHVLMGPNGAGKSTLSRVLAGDPQFEVTAGTISFDGVDLLELSPDERAQKGLFMSFQDPLEVPGVTTENFLFQAYNIHRKARGEEELSKEAFEIVLQEKVEALGVKQKLLTRGLNDGFSGGEKKRSEILQMALFDPKLAILDETDSGLDVDAIKKVASDIRRFITPQKGLILITHYHRFLSEIKPDVVHILHDGLIVRTGEASLAEQIEQEGFEAYAEQVVT